MLIQPYLMFEGRCDEAIAFYQATLGAEVVMLMRNHESPDEPPPGMLPPDSGNMVMNATLKIGESVVMMSDGNCSGKPVFQGVNLSITVADTATGERLFASLAEGGNVFLPFGKTFFSPGFGMLSDKFGVNWMVNTAH